MMNYTKAQEKAINDYLAVCIKNNYHCQHCAKNDNGICFFAFQCFANDMMHFDDSDNDCPCSVKELIRELQNVPQDAIVLGDIYLNQYCIIDEVEYNDATNTILFYGSDIFDENE